MLSLYTGNTPLYDLIFLFFFNDTATTEIYTLSLHDALPICLHAARICRWHPCSRAAAHSRRPGGAVHLGDRKSTRLNSSHLVISYAVFCLKKKKGSVIKYLALDLYRL